MNIYLIRHGRTQWNRDKRMQGQQDSPLTSEGLDQLDGLARRMKGEEIHGIYVSPLGRAMESAERVFPQKKLTTVEDLQEIALGDWEGKVYDEVHGPHVEDQDNFWDKPHLFRARPGGEDFSQLQKRSLSALEKIMAAHDEDDTIALVSHTVVIKALLHHFEGRSMDRFWEPPFLYPASLSLMEVDQGKLVKMHLYGDYSHYSDGSEVKGLL